MEPLATPPQKERSTKLGRFLNSFKGFLGEVFKPQSLRYTPEQPTDETPSWMVQEPTDEEPFLIVDLPPPTTEERLAHYAIYRRMGGEPYEPVQSLLRASQEDNTPTAA